MENVFFSRLHNTGSYNTHSRNLDDTRCNFNHTHNCTNNTNNTPIYINTATNGVIYNSNSSSNNNICIYNYNITRSNDNKNTSYNYTIDRSNNDNYNATNNTDNNRYGYPINTDNDCSDHNATNNYYNCAPNNTTYHRRANNVHVNNTFNTAYYDEFKH